MTTQRKSTIPTAASILSGSISNGPKRAEPREFAFSHDDFEKVRKLIYEKAGISLNEGKHDMVYSRLARRLRVHGLTRFSDYLELLKHGDHEEWEAFTNALTTNLTSFFREEHHFPILAQHLKALGKDRPLRIWCCAASTGEEPYSIAMTAVEAFDSFTPPVSILATDLDTHVLRNGEAGAYAVDRIERMDPRRVKRFFLKGSGSRIGEVRVRPELQRLINFKRLNLLESSWAVHGPLDAIMCRNVMIYFDKETQARILKRFAPLLAPNGLLFVGHSESLFHVSDIFRLKGKTVYELVKPNGAKS
ncbi:MAG: CheR family methyltransferase [Betaproteobacteria bacterium]